MKWCARKRATWDASTPGSDDCIRRLRLAMLFILPLAAAAARVLLMRSDVFNDVVNCDSTRYKFEVALFGSSALDHSYTLQYTASELAHLNLRSRQLRRHTRRQHRYRMARDERWTKNTSVNFASWFNWLTILQEDWSIQFELLNRKIKALQHSLIVFCVSANCKERITQSITHFNKHYC